jgi:valyl-tRNA synthetase
MSVGISQRGGEVIEPLLSEQWFVRTKPLAELALAAVKEGRTRIVPERFEKVYYHWLENIEDWCISRQLWWGHRIPVWYTADGQMIVPGPDDPEPQGEGVTQDPDVLDTWFSSGLWPFSTLGWPDDTPDLRYFYPTSVMGTGYDILFFWVARMMMMGCYLTGTEPFHTIYLHGLVRDKQGRKMSKSYGNVVNPLEVMEQSGTDALRFTLATSGTPGQDLNLNPERIEAARNFGNKIWNITRFVISKLDRRPPTTDHRPPTTDHRPPTTDHRPPAAGQPTPVADGHAQPAVVGTLADHWIMSRYRRLVAEVDRLMRAYNFGEAGRQIHEFLWSEFADWYVEVAKVQLEGDQQRQQHTRDVLYTVLEGSLRLLHPFMPFVTEELWQYLTADAAGQSSAERPPSIMVAQYPAPGQGEPNEAAERDFALLREIITGIRNIRNEYKVEPARFVAATIAAGERAALIESQRALLARLARVADDRLTIVERLDAKPENAAALVIEDVEIYLPLAGLIDMEAERARLRKELDAAEAEIGRRETRLGSPGFSEKAPANVVQRERDGLAAARATAERLRERLEQLK